MKKVFSVCLLAAAFLLTAPINAQTPAKKEVKKECCKKGNDKECCKKGDNKECCKKGNKKESCKQGDKKGCPSGMKEAKDKK